MPRRKNQTAGQRQDAIYKFLEEFAADHGYPPAVRAIGDAIGLKSTSMNDVNDSLPVTH